MKVLYSLLLTLLVVSCNNTDPNAGITETADPSSYSVTFSFTTASGNGSYAPRHTMAVWIQNADGAIVKTLGRWAASYVGTLSWYSLSGADTDVKTGATANSHGTKLVGWDLVDMHGNDVADGEYSLHIEYNENNSVSSHKISASTLSVSGGSVTITEKDETAYITDIKVTE